MTRGNRTETEKRIMDAISDDFVENTAKKLAERTGLSIVTVYNHLQILAGVGKLRTTKVGTSTLYRHAQEKPDEKSGSSPPKAPDEQAPDYYGLC